MGYNFFYTHSEIKAKSEGGSERLITGYFTTRDVDRSRDVVNPSALTDAIATYMKNPILCFNHDWNEGIGRVISIQLDEYGCKVVAKIAEGTATADKVWTLIQQGVYNAFSFAFRVLGKEYGGSEEDPIDIITNLDLLEVSVVTIPCNANSTFSIVKGFEWGSDIFPKAVAKTEDTSNDTVVVTTATIDPVKTEPATFKAVVGSESIDGGEPEGGAPEQKEAPESTEKPGDTTKKTEPGVTEPEVTQTEVTEPVAENTEVVEKTDGAVETMPEVEEKKTTPFGNYELISATTAWSGSKSRNGLAKWASSDGSGDKDKMDWGKYAKGFFWFDETDKENFSSYKLPFCYVEDGSLKAVPRGIYAAAAAVNGSRSGLNIPENEVASVKAHIEKYYKKMDKESPFKGSIIEMLSLVELTQEDKKLADFVETYNAVKVFMEEYLMNSGFELDDSDLKLMKEVIKGLFI